MADKEKKTQDPASAEQAVKPAAPARSFGTWGLFGGIMLVEGVAIFLCMKFFIGYAPDATQAEVEATSQPWEQSKELEVAQLKVANAAETRTTVFKVHVAVKVHAEFEETVKKIIEVKQFEITDGLSRVIRSADHRYFDEPGLETLKRMVRHELNKIIGDEKLVDQVLIPECMPLPTGF